MKAAFPLYAKILGWFLINVAILALAAWFFFRAQFPGGVDTLFLAPAAARIDAASELIQAELRQNTASAWPQILAKFSKAYGVQFALFANDKTIAATGERDLPEPLKSALQAQSGPRPMLGRERNFGRPPLPPGERPDFQPAIQPFSQRRPFRKSLVHTSGPDRYWVLVRMFMPEPATLLIETPSLTGGGLFIDTTPWIISGLVALGFSLLFWAPLAGGITRAISKMMTATSRIAEGRFDIRVPSRRRDELGLLAASINRMTERLEGLVNGQKRFLGDAAHELCSPLARMEVALGILGQRAGERDRASVDDVREELQAMAQLVAELLSFSKASLGGGMASKREKIPLLSLVDAVALREKIPADAFENRVPADCVALGDPNLLQRALANLFRNAARYAAGCGPFIVEARRDGDGEILLTVADSGPGVPAEALPHLFDPFYRVEASRDRESGGAGLGLAIVKTCVESCGGAVACQNGVSRGLQIILRLQAAGIS